MNRRVLAVVLLLSSSSFATDSRSLLLGIGIGLGVYTTQYVVPKVAATTKTVAKKTARGVKHVVTLGKN